MLSEIQVEAEVGAPKPESKGEKIREKMETISKVIEWAYSKPMELAQHLYDLISACITGNPQGCALCTCLAIATTLSVTSIAVGVGVGVSVGCRPS